VLDLLHVILESKSTEAREFWIFLGFLESGICVIFGTFDLCDFWNLGFDRCWIFGTGNRKEIVKSVERENCHRRIFSLPKLILKANFGCQIRIIY
jgi:hypothetical protein